MVGKVSIMLPRISMSWLWKRFHSWRIALFLLNISRPPRVRVTAPGIHWMLPWENSVDLAGLRFLLTCKPVCRYLFLGLRLLVSHVSCGSRERQRYVDRSQASELLHCPVGQVQD